MFSSCLCYLYTVVYILYGGRHWSHSVPHAVWEDSCEYLLRAPSPSQLVHVQYEWSWDNLQPISHCGSSQVLNELIIFARGPKMKLLTPTLCMSPLQTSCLLYRNMNKSVVHLGLQHVNYKEFTYVNAETIQTHSTAPLLYIIHVSQQWCRLFSAVSLCGL